MKTPARTRGTLDVRAEHASLSRWLLPAQRVIHNEVVAGITLLIAASLALLWANSPWKDSYQDLVSLPLGFQAGSFEFSLDLRHWVNDGLMVVFFFLVGLEIKRECVHGELAEWRVAIFPVAAAAGGMIVPALIYWVLNHGQETAVGWGIPIPTDIAFALGVLALLGSRIPVQLRLFLLTLAIADDIGAILVIATFYVQHISWLALSGAIAILGFIVGMRWIGLRTVGLFVVVGAIFWLAVQRSGIHPTIAGVILGLLTPSSAWFSHSTFSDRMTPLLQRFTRTGGKADAESSAAMLGRIETLAQETEPLVERLQRVVYPWVTFGVLPLFALVNCGVSFSMQGLQDSLFSPVTQGILFGLVLGKPLGVLGGSWLIVRSRIARLPAPLTWHHLWGVGALAGIGFTVSLFVTGLAFDSGNQAEQAKIGILSASVLAGSLGYCMLIVMNRLKAQ